MTPRLGERLHHQRLGDLTRSCKTWREVALCEKRLADLKTQVCGHLFVLHELLMSAMMRTLKVILITPPSSSFLACTLQNRSQCNLPSFFNECFTPAKRSPQASRWGVELGRRRRKRRSWWRRWSGRTSRDYFLWLFHYRYIVNRWFIVYFHLYLLVTSTFWQWFIAGLTLVRIYQSQVSGEPTSALVRWRNFSLRILLLWSLSIKNSWK